MGGAMKCNVLMGVRSQTLVRAVGGRPAGLKQATAIATRARSLTDVI